MVAGSTDGVGICDDDEIVGDETDEFNTPVGCNNCAELAVNLCDKLESNVLGADIKIPRFLS